jgi:hypothetical protein
MERINSRLLQGFILLAISIPLLFFILEEIVYEIYAAIHYEVVDYTTENFSCCYCKITLAEWRGELENENNKEYLF